MITAAMNPYEPFGAAKDLWTNRSGECLLSGAAGTGKSRACLEKLHAICLRWPGARCLIARKTRESLTETALVTFEQNVLPKGSPIAEGPRRSHRQSYVYPNGSVIVVGGLDKPQKIMSTEYDCIYCFVGETRIHSPSPVERAYTRKYSGPLVTIRTAAGNELTGTPNHPILTDQGWIALGKLHEGCQVVSRRFVQDVTSGRDPHVNEKPATIAEVARSLSLSQASLTERVETVGVNFHGDGAGGDVDIVTATGSLHRGFEPSVLKHPVQFRGIRGDLESQSLMGVSASAAMQFGVDASEVGRGRVEAKFSESLAVGLGVNPRLTSSLAGRTEVGSPFSVDVPSVSLPLAFAHTPRGKPSSLQFGLKGGVAEPNRRSDLDQAALSGEITLDRVVHFELADQPSAGWCHVYNLQTSDQYYYANNILAHNCQEAIELFENDWESLTTRLRNGIVPFQQIIADTNPDKPTHWLKQRCDRGDTVLIESRHEDNPRLWDRKRGEWTESGKVYIGKLDKLTGARKPRLRHGKWVQAEGVVYDDWDRLVHIIDPFEIPKSWRRVRSIDFGYTNPFSCLWIAIDDDARMYVYREILHTKRTVKVHAQQIKALSEGETYEFSVSDHDAEDRATLRENDISTIAARKDVQPGIQAVQERLKVAGDGKPRLFVFRDCLVEVDKELREAKRPCSLIEEMDSYSWRKSEDGKPVKEEPEKINDHSVDALRYCVLAVDRGVTKIEDPKVVEEREAEERAKAEEEYRDVNNPIWWEGSGQW